MNNVYIGGDSFCFWRNDSMNHWPKILANNLSLNLEGNGYPGRSWWSTRDDFINYMKTSEYDNTDLFIFCHTEPLRILSTKVQLCSPDSVSEKLRLNEIYYKHIYDEEFHNWAMVRYFEELNFMLKNKKVIHLFCFSMTRNLGIDILSGYKTDTDLWSLVQKDFDQQNKNINTEKTYNHFLPDTNQKIANFLTNLYLHEIKYQPITVKKFDITLE
jgi:hypothetical protein